MGFFFLSQSNVQTRVNICSFVVSGFSVHAHIAQSAALSCCQSCIQDVLHDLCRSLLLCTCTSQERGGGGVPLFPFLFFFPSILHFSFFLHAFSGKRSDFVLQSGVLPPAQLLCPSSASSCAGQTSCTSLLEVPETEQDFCR